MSFGVGIGDMVMLLQAIKTSYDRYKNAPGEVKDAVRDISGMHAGMTFIEKTYPLDEEEFAKLYTEEVASVLKEFLADMEPVLQELRSLIHRWNKDCTSVLKRTRFVFLYTSEMKSLQEEVGSLWKRVQGLLNLLSGGDTLVSRSKAESERIRQEKQRHMDIQTRDKHHAEVRSLLQQILNEKGEEKISAAAVSADSSSWKLLEKELEAKGLSQGQVKQLMDPIKKEINKTAGPPPPKNVLIEPKKPKNLPLPSPLSPSGNLNTDGGSPSSANRSPSPQPSSDYKPPATILVVDRTNGVRSIVAQAYLELIRAWTINTTDRWLFGRVSSAGTNVRTQFSTNVAKVPAWELPGRLVVENWITELSGSRSYFWSEDGPREKETILNKIREWKRCGLRQFHFTRYSHILCFDKATYVILMKMKALAQDPLAPPLPASEKDGKEQPLSSGKDPKAVDATIHFLGPQGSFKVPLAITIEGVKTNIKNFLITQFNWVRPPNNMGIAGGPNRTQFLWISSNSIGRIIGKGGAKRKSLEEQSKCRIIIGRQSPDEEANGRMVVIVGKMAAVEKAKGLVLETAGAA